MSSPSQISVSIDDLLAGPRGRRLCLEFVLESERLQYPDFSTNSFRAAAFRAGYELDPGKGRSVVYIGHPGNEPMPPAPLPTDVSDEMQKLTLATVTPEMLRTCIARSVDMARYWQEPDGQDILATCAEMLPGLRKVAEHILSSPLTRRWVDPLSPNNQWAIPWEHTESTPPTLPSTETELRTVLETARHDINVEEARAILERPTDPSARWSGIWWSMPPFKLARTSPEFFDSSPAGLWFVEDSMGWEEALAFRLGVPTNLRVYEIDSAEAWAHLCREYPLEVTASKRHDWYRTTGRDGDWVMPDWAAFAEHYDVIHLQTFAYLAVAGTAIHVTERAASVISGWAPDTSFWFTDRVRYVDSPVAWKRIDAAENWVWEREGLW